MDALVPMAAQPTAMSSRNWMMRRLIIDSIRNDPEWNGGDYDAASGLERITASLLAINAADDERNPPETGLMQAALKQVKNARLYLIPASDETRGHGTTGMARFYAKALADFLRSLPPAVR